MCSPDNYPMALVGVLTRISGITYFDDYRVILMYIKICMK